MSTLAAEEDSNVIDFDDFASNHEDGAREDEDVGDGDGDGDGDEQSGVRDGDTSGPGFGDDNGVSVSHCIFGMS